MIPLHSKMTTMIDDICLICHQSLYNDKNKWYCNGCEKVIAHKDPCINEWFKIKKECPHCKKHHDQICYNNDIETANDFDNLVFIRQYPLNKVQKYLLGSIILIISGYIYYWLIICFSKLFCNNWNYNV